MNHIMLGGKSIKVVALLLGLIATDAAHAQQMLLDQVVRNRWLDFRIVGGRIRVEGARLGNIQTNTKGLHRDETLGIRNENGQIALNYRRTNNVEELLIEIEASGDRMLIRRTPRGKSLAQFVEFHQDSDKKISLALGSGTEQQVFCFPDIWQLLISRPQECQKHLLPLLEMLRPRWKLTDAASEVETELLANAGREATFDRSHWAALVARLADDSFANREAADRALRAGNASVLAYLQQLDFERLDAEQQFRIRRIIASMMICQNRSQQG